MTVIRTFLTAALAAPAFALATVASAEPPAVFDVAADGTSFVFAEHPVHEGGGPAYGNPFIVQGYIYPKGTLDGAPGVTEDGAPQYPARVLGTWTCTGWFVGDGIKTESGAWVVSRQVYHFEGEDGGDLLISQGPELVDRDTPFSRAVTGGTGAFAYVSGQITQTFLGFHPHGGVKLRFEIGGVWQFA